MSISLRDVRKSFDGQPAVDGVTLEIEPGEFFVVLGPSGCGKSTLLRLIAGLETLDAGAIALGGAPVAGPGLHAPPEARGVGVVFQSYALWPHMTAAENVAFPIETRGVERRAARAEAAGHLAAVALEPFAERKPASLSGGQRQRVALARCLAGGARTVLMDEPLANLDPHLRDAMETELAAFHARAGATTLYITHDQREAMALADRIAVMRAGRIEQADRPENLYARPASEAIARFIGRGAALDAVIEAASGTGGQARLSARAGPFAIEAARGAAPAKGAARGAARIFVRPEEVRIENGVGAAPGRIAAVAYRGGKWEAEAAVEGLSEPLAIESRQRLAPGEVVPLQVSGCWVLPA